METRSPAASPNTCDIPVPNTGDDCSSLLVLSKNYVACLFMQTETANGQVTSDATVSCTCDSRSLDSTADAKWDCDGTLPPASEPSLMPAGQSLPAVVMPVPTVPVPVTTVNCPPEESKPNDGDSCMGILPESTLSSATCTYGTTTTSSLTTVLAVESCTCPRNTQKWKCTGGPSAAPLPAVVAAPVSVAMPVSVPEPDTSSGPEMVPEPDTSSEPEMVNVGDGFSEWVCRPFGSGCSAPHTIPADCEGTSACCPGNIITDWRTDRPTCEHSV